MVVGLVVSVVVVGEVVTVVIGVVVSVVDVGVVVSVVLAVGKHTGFLQYATKLAALLAVSETRIFPRKRWHALRALLNVNQTQPVSASQRVAHPTTV